MHTEGAASPSKTSDLNSRCLHARHRAVYASVFNYFLSLVYKPAALNQPIKNTVIQHAFKYMMMQLLEMRMVWVSEGAAVPASVFVRRVCQRAVGHVQLQHTVPAV